MGFRATSSWMILLVGGSLFAATPTVESITPVAGLRGIEFTLTINGARLTDPQEVMLDTPGINCTKLVAKSENEVLATFKTTPDCKLGQVPFRLRTRSGISELRLFQITPFPVIAEDEPNDSLEKAQQVPLNSSVHAVAESGDYDWYAVKLKKGQRLSAEVLGVRLGGDLTDTSLSIYGPDGKLIQKVDDTSLFRQDPFASIIASIDGTHYVVVQEATLNGGNSSKYLLHVGDFLRPSMVFPAGGQAGQTVEVQLLGDPAGPTTRSVKLPGVGEDFAFFPTTSGTITPTPNPFRVSPFANVIEAEPNDKLDQAVLTSTWPIAFNGVLRRPGDIDHFRFRGKKGDNLAVQAFAFRLGSLADTVVSVLDSKGELLGFNDDDETHDSRLSLILPEDGDYFVKVTDKRGQGSSKHFYRIELDQPKPGLIVFMPERIRKSQDRQVISVPRGNRVTAYLAVRRDGCDGPVQLKFDGLPKGLTAKLDSVSNDEYLLPVVFEASADAPLGGQLVSLNGESTSGPNLVRGSLNQTITLVRGPGDSSLHSVDISKLAIVVVEESPVSVAIIPPTVPLTPDSTLEVKLKLTRQPGFTDPIDITFPSLPPGVEVPTTVQIPADKSEATVVLVASPEADLGDWKLIAEAGPARRGRADRDPLSVGMNGLGTPNGTTMPKGRRRKGSNPEEMLPVASQAVAGKTISAPITGLFKTASCEQGKSTRIICDLKVENGFSGIFTAKLDGLPPRAKANPVEVNSTTKQIAFEVTIDPTTPLGEVKSLVCELAGTVNGQSIVLRVGRGGRLTVAAPGTLKLDANGQPLSPLDALRNQSKK
jgi:hypothetical protein